MKEAIGSTWLLGIVLTFMALFSGYLAFSVNYSKAFRMKDGIIDIIEKHNGPNRDAINEINDLMTEISYSSTGDCKTFFNNSTLNYIGVTKNVVTSKASVGTKGFNYCIQQVDTHGQDGQLSSAYFKVYVFFSLSLPVFDTMSSFNVSGETIAIYFPDTSCMNGC